MLLPQERDESADPSRAAQAPRPEMKQAEADVASGKEDTDCHTQPPLAPGGHCTPSPTKNDPRKE
jgi:hypothetical protein